jgi:PAS domain S-box-containing protein
MSDLLRILLLEDSEQEARLIERQLRRADISFTITRVTNAAEFRQALASEAPDLILADYSLPNLEGMTALRLVRESHPDLPFIFVSGSLGEDRAIEALREGATDFILKDRPWRLPPAILRAIDQRRERVLRESEQESLLRSERRFELAALATRDVIWELDVPSQKLWVSDAMLTEWGHEVPPGAIDLDWWNAHIDPHDVGRVDGSRQRCLLSGEVRWKADYRFRRASGEYGSVRHHALVIRDAEGRAKSMVGAMMDVTDYTQAMEQCGEAERTAQLGSWTIDATTRAVQWSDQTFRILGLDPETTTASEELFFSHVHPDDRENVLAESRVLRAMENEFRICRTDGAVRTIYTKVGRVESDGQKVVRAVGTLQDVTERKRLEQQLEQAERISTLGRVAATIAHEFNNVLMGIQPFAEVIGKRAGDTSTVQHAAAQIVNSVGRGRNIAQQILRVARPSQPMMQTIDAAEWLRDVANQLRAILGHTITVALHVPKTPLYVSWDPAQMHQVIINLALNSRDAMQAGGTLTLTAEERNGTCRLTVDDTGHGIPPEVLPHIFEPLFTTKHAGTGLGLGVVQQVVTKHGGTINVDSRMGSGTSVSIEFPAAAAPSGHVLSAPPTGPPPVKRILMVEDDGAISSGIAALLSMEGIEVRVAERGADALSMIEPFAPEAVILDLSLPDIDGFEVYQRISARWPDLPVVFSSGHSVIEQFGTLPSGRVAFLRKPYDLQSLLAKLHEVLSASLQS